MRHVGQMVRVFSLFSNHTSLLVSTFFCCCTERKLPEVGFSICAGCRCFYFHVLLNENSFYVGLTLAY